jgi:C-terminal peptidase prc
MIRFLSIFVVLSIVSFTAFAKKSMKEHWQQSGITSEALKMWVNNEHCKQSFKVFSGCHSAIQDGFRYNQANTWLLAMDTSWADSESVELVEPFKVVVTKDPEDLDFKASLKLKKGRKAKVKQQLQKLYQKIQLRAVQPVDFEAMIDKAFAELKNQEERALLVGLMVNSYLGKAVDPHTSLMPQSVYAENASGEAEEYFGIGVLIDKVDQGILVKNCFRGGPALKFGVQVNDVITHINGEAIVKTDGERLPLDEIVSRIKGPEGTEVTVQLIRGDQKIELSIQRGRVVVENIEAKMIGEAGDIGYIRIDSFTPQNTCMEFGGKLYVDLIEPGARGIILDLRGNPGGNVAQAACVIAKFIGPEMPFMVEQSLIDGNQSLWRTPRNVYQTVKETPVVVLIDATSASASEIVAGALQHYKKAVVIGERSFGKGVMQSVMQAGRALKGISESASAMSDVLSVDDPHLFMGFHLSLTTSFWLLPSGKQIQSLGIEPDITVYVAPNPTEMQRFAWRAEDQYGMAYGNETAAFVQPRPEYVSSIKTCVENERQVEVMYQEQAQFKPDYQLMYGVEAIECIQ